MPKYVDIKDLTDSSLFDEDGFPLDTTKSAIREQRKHGVHSWGSGTKIDKSIWDSAGANFEAISRIPYRYDMPLKDSSGNFIYDLDSGSGPENDMKVYLRKDIPIDAEVDINVNVLSSEDQVITDPTYDLQFDITGMNTRTKLELNPVEYEMILICTWDNPLGAGTYTAAKTIKDISTCILDVNDNSSTKNKNVTTYNLLKYNSSYVGQVETKYLIPDFKDFKISTVSEYLQMSVPEELYPSKDGDWTLEVGYVPSDINIIENIGNASPYVVDQTVSDNKMFMSVIVKPFTRLQATEIAIGDSSYTKTYRTTSKSIYILEDIAEEIKRDLRSMVEAEVSPQNTQYFTDISPVQIKCVETGKTSATESMIYFNSNNPSPMISYANLDEITGLKIVGDIDEESKTITVPVFETRVLPYKLNINELKFGDTQYLNIRDLITDYFGVDLDTDTFSPFVSNIDTAGIVISYEPYRLIVKRIDCPEDSLLYARCGYLWLSGEEKYLYNDDKIVISNPSILDNKINISSSLGGYSILDFSPVLILIDEVAVDYNYNIDDTTGEKTLTGLVNSYYTDSTYIYLSSDITSIDTITIQPDTFEYIDTKLNVNPLLSWSRRYFTEYSEYDQVATSLSAFSYDNLIVVFVYDQYGNPVLDADVTIEVNSSVPEDSSIRLLHECADTTSITYSTNDEGRVTVYYHSLGSSDILDENEILITAVKEDVVSKTVTLSNSWTKDTNINYNWSLSVDAPSSVRLGGSFTAKIKTISENNEQLLPVDYVVYYKNYDNFGIIDEEWIEEESSQETTSEFININPTKVGLYKIEIVPTGYSGKVIYFRSY